MKYYTKGMMKNFILVFLLLFVSSKIFAQDAETVSSIKLSTDKVKIEGKHYYIHIVRQGETLYSISKAYNLSQIEVAMENPDIYLGLQVNQALKIPIKGQQFDEGNEDEDYVYHVVRRRETLTSLTRKYDVQINEIQAANPGIDEDIKVNQVILIPKKRLSQIGVTGKDDFDKFFYHEVKPREGFYSLKRQYGVSEEVVRKYNQELVADGLKLGTVLRIPKNLNDTTLIPKPIAIHKPAETVHPLTEEKKAVSVICDTFQYNRYRNVYNVVVLLPFTQLTDDQPIDSTQISNDQGSYGHSQSQDNQRISNQTASFLDFYQGVLLALDSLKEIGMSINLSVFDTEKNADKARALTNEKDLQEAHLIIGPAFPECLQPIAEFALEQRIPIVSPLSPNNFLLDRNPYLFQVNPSFLTQLEEFTSYIDLCSGQNIVLIHEADSTNMSMVNGFKKMISSSINNCPSSNLIHFKEVYYSPGSPAPQVQERISHSLNHDRENLILVPSNNEAFVSDLLGNLHTLSTIYKYPISMYGFPRWQRFRNVQIDYYYQLQLHLFTPFYVNYSNGKVKSFITKYRDAFRVEPSQFAFQGYDVTVFFLTAMKEYGRDFQFCLPNHSNNLLQSKYNFRQVNSLSGFENRSVYIINYTKDYDIVEAKKIKRKQVVIPAEYIDESNQGRKEAVIIR